MADNQRPPYRSNETLSRAPSAPAAPAGGTDPLAELARLIGQNDPFSEFGRDGARRAAPPPQRPANPAPEWAPQIAAPSPPPAPGFGNDYYNPGNAAATREPQDYGAQNFVRPQAYGAPPFAAGSDIYRTGHDEQAYADTPAQDDGYEHDPYYQNKMQMPADEEDLYDEPPSHRRKAIVAVAAVFALAVIGTAGAFGYRVLFSSSHSNEPPPVIKADTAPSKIVPATSRSDQSSGKTISDRVGDRGQNEQMVSREEQPVDVKDKQVGTVTFPNQGGAQAATLGSGVVGSEPKKIRTIAIHPDQLADAAAAVPPMTTPPASAPAPKVSLAAVKPVPLPTRVAASAPPAADTEPPPPAPAPRQVVARSAPAPVENAPMSLSPDSAPAAPARAAAPARSAPAPTRLAPAASAPAASGGGGNYAVQVSAQRSEAEAQAAFRALQGKFPSQLGNREPVIHRADLGDKGIYFRAMVGPFASSGEAGELCSSLKAAGGQCIVQRN
jgi:hypothetical protein